jgi:hypothetical protein
MTGIGNGIARGQLSPVMSLVMSWPHDRMQRSHSRGFPAPTGQLPRDAGGENR